MHYEIVLMLSGCQVRKTGASASRDVAHDVGISAFAELLLNLSRMFMRAASSFKSEQF